VQAIELLRSVTGCRLTEAKAVVDRLTQGGARDSD
jgi:ribosomal protein L7/L12